MTVDEFIDSLSDLEPDEHIIGKVWTRDDIGAPVSQADWDSKSSEVADNFDWSAVDEDLAQEMEEAAEQS
tara:strand:+ start:10472 stop:10681 length:210 start_codon:yes stop_codon:yes gene_type:complete